MTIIEKLRKYSNVGFGIVLYTPCDIGYAKDKETEKWQEHDKMLFFLNTDT